MALRSGHATGTISWIDGTPFNGFALVSVGVPQASGVSWPSIALGGQFPLRTIPLYTEVGIVNGIFDQTVSVLYNADIVPPISDYAAWYFDTNGVEIAGPTSTFTVASDPFTMPTVTLPIPTAGTPGSPD